MVFAGERPPRGSPEPPRSGAAQSVGALAEAPSAELLEVSVMGPNDVDYETLPRVRLGSVSYALHAGVAQSVCDAQLLGKPGCGYRCRADGPRQANHSAGPASRRARARPAPMPCPGVHPRQVRRRASPSAAGRGGRSRTGQRPHLVLRPPSREPPRGPDHRMWPWRRADVSTRRRHELRSRRHAAGRRCTGEGLFCPASPGLSRAREPGRARRVARPRRPPRVVDGAPAARRLCRIRAQR